MNLRPNPPNLFLRFFRWFCHPDLVNHVEGDLMELYGERLGQFGKKKADLKFIMDVLLLFRPGIIGFKDRPVLTPILLLMNLYKHYVVITFRNIMRHKTFSAINIAGLALGMICCFLIFLWIGDERRVDNFHAKGKRLYNLYETITVNNETVGYYFTPTRYPFAKREYLLADIENIIPEAECLALYATGYDLPWGHPETFQVGDKTIKLEGSRANEHFLTMFSFPLLIGDPVTALRGLHSIAISRKMAGLFFDSPEEAIGKSIRFENRVDLTITAVFDDITPKSSLRFDYLIDWNTLESGEAEFASNHIESYILLKENADAEVAARKIDQHLKAKGFEIPGGTLKVGLQPFGERYLHATFENGKPTTGRIAYVKIFSGAALFILIIAAINFMNLATARSVKRAKEVGVRKVVGSSRFYLISQFLGESVLLSVLAFLVSLVALYFLLPIFNELTGKHIVLPIQEPSYWIAAFAIVLLTGVVAGSYPALFLSSLTPTHVLKGTVRFTNGSIFFRKGLSVFQFSLSIMLLIATIVVSLQTDFVQHFNLGYDRENLIYIRIEGNLNPKYAVFKEQAEKMPGIALVDRSTETPHAMGFVTDDPIHWEGQEEGQVIEFKPASVGFDFLKIMNLKLAEGRGFSRDFATDSADAFLVNEEAVRQMSMKDPIGKWVSAWKKSGHIVGILKDYNTHSMHEKIMPVMLDVKEYEEFGVILVRTEPGKTEEALASLKKVCKDINPNYPFVYQFVDQEYEKLYQNEKLVTKLSNISAALAIIISCLGLLGLVMFSAEQRTKEFGIRKVLGASVSQIVALLSQDFIKLMAISFCIATPVAAYLMYQWLQDFAFRIDLSWWIFILAGGAAMLLAMLTISYQAIHTGRMNPVDNLKVE